MLEGSLETFPLASVLRLLDDTAHTGRLAVNAALGRGSLVLERGRLVGAEGPGSDPVETALGLFEHHTGTFSFRLESVTERTLDLDIAEFLEIVEERAAAWAGIREHIPLDGPLVVVPLEAGDRLDGEVTVSTEAWRIAVLANGRTANQLATIVGASEFRVCGVLLELLQAGLIGFGGRTNAARSRPAEPEATVPPADQAEEQVEEPEPGPARAEDADLDPEMLLRELGEAEPAARPPRKRLSRR